MIFIRRSVNIQLNISVVKLFFVADF